MKKINDQQVLFAVGLNHKTAPIEVREKLYLHQDEVPALLAKLKETLTECFVLSTCNRTEIYGVCGAGKADLGFYIELLIKFKNVESLVTKEHFFTALSAAASQQLFSVAASIDSKIIGDTQILKQLKDAYLIAKEHGFTGRILNQLLQRAFKIGKKVYAETSINKGAVSISLAAVQLAIKFFGSLKDKSVLIIGAGKTAKLTTECLIKRQVGKIFITNRTCEHAQRLLQNLPKKQDFESEIIDFADFKNYLNEIDIVISSTGSPDPILEAGDFAHQKNKILLIDIATPRDIAPETTQIETVILKNIDDLQAMVDRNFEQRMNDLPHVKKIITTEVGEFLTWYYSLPLIPVLPKNSTKPDRETVNQILKIKEFVKRHVPELDKLKVPTYALSRDDLNGHLQLGQGFQIIKNTDFEVLNG